MYLPTSTSRSPCTSCISRNWASRKEEGAKVGNGPTEQVRGRWAADNLRMRRWPRWTASAWFTLAAGYIVASRWNLSDDEGCRNGWMDAN